ncbi:Short-chain dehydrogenase/reductase SDR [Penicillium taxi]|uniref:Short-chain dehydrogenase/reductase SDR n=1 Tax=Penicillium taxi TaxID=168475 RepID=UPI002544E7E5|nr:Short-chain dehydrogenase/reductase SDR [Penicillium taxi]KAJ5902194.1 Short-chain dehydrogenase/reductase SDR [Penicillium taxi]
MPSYLVTGASRGLGFEFVRHLSQNPNNTVIGLVRDKAAADAKAKSEGVTVYMVEAQYTDLLSLKNAAESVKSITGRGLDYLIHNAAVLSHISALKTFGDFDDDFETLEKDLLESLNVNLLGYIKTVQAFIPLIREGKKKNKAALNVAVAKYNALYNQDGILFLAISPGVVSTERSRETNPEDAEKLQALASKFVAYAPHFSGPINPEESVSAFLSVVDKLSVANGDGGAFISHLGNKQWV